MMVRTNASQKLLTMSTPLMRALVVTVAFSTSFCFAGDLPGSEIPATVVPPAGSVLFLFTTGVDSAGAEGSVGTGVGGLPRILDTPCP